MFMMAPYFLSSAFHLALLPFGTHSLLLEELRSARSSPAGLVERLPSPHITLLSLFIERHSAAAAFSQGGLVVRISEDLSST
jgi:hypothetical protein